MIQGGQRDGRSDADPLRAVGRLERHQVHRRADAVCREVVLGQPHGVIAGIVHRVDALQRPLVHGVERDSALGPAEELEDSDLHVATISAATGMLCAEGKTKMLIEPSLRSDLLAGQVAIVTGGSRGIGGGTSTMLAANGRAW